MVKNYQTITPEADDGKTILIINPGRMRDITEQAIRQEPSLAREGLLVSTYITAANAWATRWTLCAFRPATHMRPLAIR
ncbi:hypothetical protein D3C80_1566090 [compost metagenome]